MVRAFLINTDLASLSEKVRIGAVMDVGLTFRFLIGTPDNYIKTVEVSLKAGG